jgi:hypothetical protein
VQWQSTDIDWKLPLPGVGQSSPIVWGRNIFLTTATDEGRKRFVLCIDRQERKIVWQQQVPWEGTPEPLHRMNSYATPTCVTDGQLVVAFFGVAGLHAYRVTGEHVWSRDLGDFPGPWGTAASPILLGEVVIQNCDADTGAYLIAVDARTGQTKWSTPRPDFRGWSTPIVIEVDGKQQLVLNGHTGVKGYDPLDGRELWHCKSFNGRGEPTITPAGGLLVAVNGLPGDIYAVRPGGTGDVTATHMAWHTPRRGARDLPSPIAIGDYVLVSTMNGVLTCYQATTGKVRWQERLGGNFSASPVAAAGKAFFWSEAGEMIAIEPGDDPKIIARSTLPAGSEEIFRASPTPCEGQWLIRSQRVLYCVGKR